MLTTWRKGLTSALENNGETWADVEAHTLTEAQLDTEFSNSFGEPMGDSFTLWTKARVYFPATYGGSEWVADVPRHPNGESTEHIGGH